MSAQGESAGSLDAARRALAARDAELADADRVLAEAVAGVHAIAVDSIGRLDAIRGDIDSAVTDQPRDSAGAAHEFGRHLVRRNRDIAAVVSEAVAAVNAETTTLRELRDRYRITPKA